MSTLTTDQLREKSCVPCEGGVAKFTAAEAREQLQQLDGWKLADDAKSIERKWQVADFMAGMDFLDRVARLAEDEGHHPDLHLVGYKNVRIELSTHAIGGLSENDFVLAAKIDELPIETKA